MRRILSLSLITLLVAAFGTWGGHAPSKPEWKIRSAERGERGPFPSDWFMQQRTWPDAQIDIGDYHAAQRQAERLANRTLDEHPPWIPVGPDNIGGRIADIAVHPTNAQIYYVAAASGGVFKTTNGGGSWSAVFDAMPSMSMGALAIDPLNPGVVYAGTGEASSGGYSYFGTGIYKSTDAGATWQASGLENSRYIARIVLEPANPQRIWVAAMGEVYATNTERGVYLSPDGGLTWQRKLYLNDSTGASDVVVHPTNPQIVFAAMWQRIRGPEVRQAGGRASGIFRSTDAGETWTRLTDGLPVQADTVGRIGIAISPSNPSVLYAIYANHPGFFMGLFKSVDGGETWTRTNDSALEDIYSSFGWYFGNVRVRPDNPNVVFALGVDLYRSMDGGQSWEDVGWGVHVDHHAMSFEPGQPTRILLGNDGGMYRTTNNGNSWTFQTGLPVNQFYAATVDPQFPQRRYGGTQDNGTLQTLTGTVSNWQEILGGDGFYVLVDPTNSQRIYAEYQWGYLCRSEDGGVWFDYAMDGINPSERTNWSTPIALDPQNAAVVYYGAERLYRSNNNGNWWDAISPDLTDGGGAGNLNFGTITTIGVSPLNHQIIWAGTDDANVWVSTNYGASWQNRSQGLPNRWITRVSPDPLDSNGIYVCLSGFRNPEQNAHLFYSSDLGVTWQSISGDLPEGPLNDVIPDPNFEQRLYAASDFGTFVSVNRGQQWVALGEDLPRVPVLDLVLHNPTRQLVAATYGRSMYTLALSELDLNRPPVLRNYAPASIDTLPVPGSMMFSFFAVDPDSDSVIYRWTREGEFVGDLTHVELFFEQAGVHERVEVTASDGEIAIGHVWEFVTGSVGVGNLPAVANRFDLTVYPNPFNSAANIVYDLPNSGYVEISVFDITGRQTATLLNSWHAAGQWRYVWRADNIASGSYFVQLKTGRERRIVKVLLLR